MLFEVCKLHLMTSSTPICVPQRALLCVEHLMPVQKTSRTSVEPPELESGAKPQLECRCGTGYKKDPCEGHRSRIPWGDSSTAWQPVCAARVPTPGWSSLPLGSASPPRLRRGRSSPSSLSYFSAIRATLRLAESFCPGLCSKPYSPWRGTGSGCTACGQRPHFGAAFPGPALGTCLLRRGAPHPRRTAQPPRATLRSRAG